MITNGKDQSNHELFLFNHKITIIGFESVIEFGKEFYNINMDRSEVLRARGMIPSNYDFPTDEPTHLEDPVEVKNKTFHAYHDLDLGVV